MDENKRIVEVNGIKIEVDLRTAKRIDTYKVGDPVKLLKKKYSDSYESYPGAVVGFDEFNTLPTIIVAYIENDYSGATMKFQYINNNTKETEIAPIQEFEKALNLKNIIDKFDSDITSKKAELEKKQKEKIWFLENWQKYFGKVFSDLNVDIEKE